jgi:hypothetical protein
MPLFRRSCSVLCPKLSDVFTDTIEYQDDAVCLSQGIFKTTGQKVTKPLRQSPYRNTCVVAKLQLITHHSDLFLFLKNKRVDHITKPKYLSPCAGLYWLRKA